MNKHDDVWNLFQIDGLSRDVIKQLAFEAGFCQRNSGKIDAPDFLLHFCLQSLEGTVSYNDLAATIETKTGINASRQAYHQRMGKQCNDFFQKVLEAVMRSKQLPEDPEAFVGAGTFRRILIQDSTIIRLPLRLFEIFSGVKNAHSWVCNARIQGIYDLLSKQFVAFSIDPYKKTILRSALI
jgi:hypothetical protein